MSVQTLPISKVGNGSIILSFTADFFHGEEAKNVRLGGLDHVISVTAQEGKIHICVYR